MGQAKQKQRAALAGVGERGAAAPPPAAPVPSKPLTAKTANELHELYCRLLGAGEHLQACQQAWLKGLIRVADALDLNSDDPQRLQVQFLERTLTLKPPAAPAAPPTRTETPPSSAPDDAPAADEQQESADDSG